MAIGSAGTTGISSVLGVDASATVPLSGTLVDEHGARLPGIHLVIAEEESPDGGLAGSSVITAADGSFSATIYAWGTADAPATLTISTPPDEQLEVLGTACTQTWAVAVTDTRPLTLAETTAPPAAIEVVAQTTLLGEVCGTTGQPPANSGAGRGSRVTPPPTDLTTPILERSDEQLGPALVLGFLVGLVAAAALLIPRPGARQRP
jgi:hypothetical protein